MSDVIVKTKASQRSKRESEQQQQKNITHTVEGIKSSSRKLSA